MCESIRGHVSLTDTSRVNNGVRVCTYGRLLLPGNISVIANMCESFLGPTVLIGNVRVTTYMCESIYGCVLRVGNIRGNLQACESIYG